MNQGGDRAELTAIIADDEALARQRIVDLLRRRSDIRVVSQCVNGADTVEAVLTHGPDILFLDVQMPGLDGFDALEMLEPEERPAVIFSTAYDEYALAAFEVHAVDYLLKPYADERFQESLRRAEAAIRGRQAAELQDRLRAALADFSASPSGGASPGPRLTCLDRFAIRDGERFTVIDAAEVDWIEARRDYVRLHTGDRMHVLRTTMAGLEQRLDPDRFLRIHRSTIVQLDRVRQLEIDGHGEYSVLIGGSGRRLRVGRAYRDSAFDRLGVKL
jgi:two-component system LytT family response regulator